MATYYGHNSLECYIKYGLWKNTWYIIQLLISHTCFGIFSFCSHSLWGNAIRSGFVVQYVAPLLRNSYPRPNASSAYLWNTQHKTDFGLQWYGMRYLPGRWTLSSWQACHQSPTDEVDWTLQINSTTYIYFSRGLSYLQTKNTIPFTIAFPLIILLFGLWLPDTKHPATFKKK